MHDYDKLLRAALMTAHRYARGGYADRGFVEGEAAYDPMGNVIVGGGSEDTSSPLYKAIEAASIGLGKAGAAVGEPLRRGAENYLGNVGQAFHESGEYAKQGLENTVSDKGPLYNTSGPLQYALGSMGQAFSPLTGAAMSAGQAATQLTGNPDIGKRVEFVGGMMDPSHVGMLKGAAAIPMAARTAAKAEEAAQAVALAKQARELSPLGFYSHGAEMAANLPQAKGTPEQMAAMLQKYGVKPAEMEGFGEAFAGRPSVTREEIAAHFKERMPQIEETVLGGMNRDLDKAWETVDRLGDKLYAAGVEDQTALMRGEFNPDLYAPEVRSMAKEYADAQRYINEQSESGRFAHNDPTKFHQYTLPGGENYREVLLKYEPNPSPISEQKYYDLANKAEREVLSDSEKNQMRAYTAWKNNDEMKNIPSFKSQHWDDPNVLAHLRMADRTGPNGEKILHVEEIQSDWGQKGKKEGFKEEAKNKFEDATNRLSEIDNSLNNKFKELENSGMSSLSIWEHPEIVALNDQRNKAAKLVGDLNLQMKSGLPTAPYVTNTQAWTDLALKRALREAAEGGYDKLVWTPGAEQAKRYDLSRHIDNITWSAEPDGKYWVGATKDGRPVRGLENEPMDAKKLEATFGKEIAEKIVKGEGRKIPGGPEMELAGLDLQAGGEGMKGYYDKIVPTQLSKLVKKLDPEAKLEKVRINGPSGSLNDLLERAGLTKDEWVDLGDAGREFIRQKYGTGNEMPSLTITPKMREAILGGQTAFKRGGTIPFGPEAAQRAVQIAKQQAGRR